MKKVYCPPLIYLVEIFNEECIASGSVYPTNPSNVVFEEFEIDEQDHSFDW